MKDLSDTSVATDEVNASFEVSRTVSINDRSFPAFAGTAVLLPRNSLRGSAAHRTARRLAAAHTLSTAEPSAFRVTRQSHVTSLTNPLVVIPSAAEG